MIDTLSLWFHVIAEILYYVNPILMGFASVMWMILHNRTAKFLSRMYLRCYSMEKQIDFLVNNRDVDREYFNYMTKTYKELEDRIK